MTPPHIQASVGQELIYNGSVQTQDVAWKTCWKQWTIEINGKRGSGKFTLAALDNDDYFYNSF